MRYIKLFNESSSDRDSKFDQSYFEDYFLEFIDNGWKINEFTPMFYLKDFTEESRIPFNNSIPGYYFKLINDDDDDGYGVRDVIGYNNIKKSIDNKIHKLKQIQTICNRIESFVGPVKLSISSDSFKFSIYEKDRVIEVSEYEAEFIKFKQSIKALLNTTFHGGEVEISDMNSKSFSIKFVDALTKSRWNTLSNKLKYLSGEIPYAKFDKYKWFIGDIKRFNFTVNFDYSSRTIIIKDINKKEHQ